MKHQGTFVSKTIFYFEWATSCRAGGKLLLQQANTLHKNVKVYFVFGWSVGYFVSGRVWTELRQAGAVFGFRTVLWGWTGWPQTPCTRAVVRSHSKLLLHFSPNTHLLQNTSILLGKNTTHTHNPLYQKYIFTVISKSIGTLHESECIYVFKLNIHAVDDLLSLNILSAISAKQVFDIFSTHYKYLAEFHDRITTLNLLDGMCLYVYVLSHFEIYRCLKCFQYVPVEINTFLHFYTVL